MGFGVVEKEIKRPVSVASRGENGELSLPAPSSFGGGRDRCVSAFMLSEQSRSQRRDLSKRGRVRKRLGETRSPCLLTGEAASKG